MAKTPHFFKIILNDDPIQSGKLGIPKKFVRRFGYYLSEKAFLKVPGGVKWRVELVKTGDTIWFGNGWQQFADYYSVSYGSFLVFGFEDFRNCTFSVLIFDRTTSEIDYPFHVNQHNEDSNLDEEPVLNEEDSDVEVLPTRISKDTSPIPSSRPCKKRKQENNRTQSKAKRSNEDRFAKRIQRLTAEEKNNAFHRTQTSCKCDNPSFSIVMHPTYVGNKKEKVTIPVTFANKYFRKQRGIIILNSVGGKTWSVEYASYTVFKTSRLTMITSGWRKFAEENHLAIGDVCVFELVDHNASKLKVVICRENQDSAKSIPSIGNSKHLKHKDIPCLEEFASVNPYFKVKLPPGCFDKRLINVPETFVAKCKNWSVGKAILQVEKKVFPVKLLSYPSINQFKFSAGVSAFVHENSVQVGDVCVFELINGETMRLKVSIFRKP